MTLSVDISGTGGLVKNGAGALTLSGSNSHASNTLNGGSLTLTGSNTIASTTVNAGTVTIASQSNLGTGDVSFTAAGTNLTITGTAVTLANNIALGNVTGNVTLKTPNNSSTVINGTVSGGGVGTVWFFQGGETGQNTGAFTLNGNNTLQGTINVQRGPVILGNSNAAGASTILLDSNSPAAGALQLGNFTISNNLSLVSGASVGTATGITATINGALSGTAAFVKVGAGTLVLGGVNTYSGATNINAGTLQIDGTLDTAAGVVTVGTGSTLSGTGAINRPVTVTGTIAPGAAGAAGTLPVTGNTAVTGAYACQVDGATQDVLAVTGDLTLGAAAALNVSEITPGTAFPHVIATYSGTLSGTFATVTPGYTVDYGTGSNSEIKLIKSGYDAWKLQITDVDQQARDKDPDGDGFTNLQEFLFGTSPIANDGTLTTTEKSGGNLIIRWKQRASGAGYKFMESATLADPWAESAIVPTNDGSEAGGYQPRKAEVSIGSGKFFFRVEGVEN